MQSFQFPPNFSVSLSTGTYSVNVLSNTNAFNRFNVVLGNGCSSATSGQLDQDRVCTLFVSPNNSVGERQAEVVTGGQIGKNTSLIPEPQAAVVVAKTDNLFQSCKQVQIQTSQVL